MNEMILAGPADKRMSSLEIAELVESRHDKVKQSIERLANRGVMTQPPMGDESYKDGSGRNVVTKVYLLDKRSSLIVVAQLSPEFTARVVDRWQELEAQAATGQFKIPSTLPEALRLAADLSEQNEKLQITLDKQAPKVALANAIEATTKAISIEQFVKTVSGKTGFVIGRNNFYKWLRKDGVLNNKNLPYQDYINAGWFEVAESTYETATSNGPRPCFTTLITGRGQVQLYARMRQSKNIVPFLNKKSTPNWSMPVIGVSQTATA